MKENGSAHKTPPGWTKKTQDWIYTAGIYCVGVLAFILLIVVMIAPVGALVGFIATFATMFLSDRQPAIVWSSITVASLSVTTLLSIKFYESFSTLACEAFEDDCWDEPYEPRSFLADGLMYFMEKYPDKYTINRDGLVALAWMLVAILVAVAFRTWLPLMVLPFAIHQLFSLRAQLENLPKK